MRHSKSRLVEDADESAPVRGKLNLPGWTEFGAVTNRTYRAWGKYRIIDDII